MKQGLPSLIDAERATDFDEAKARLRYRFFKESYAVIKELQKTFHFTVVDATPTKAEVALALQAEFQYQSSLDLSAESYNIIDVVPTVSSISLHARQLLVKRLDSYAEHHSALLSEAVDLIQSRLVPHMQRASISGRAAIRVENARLTEEPLLVDMVLDVLSDRGFHIYVERISKYVPLELAEGQILHKKRIIHRFFVEFPRSLIRSSHRIQQLSAHDRAIDDEDIDGMEGIASKNQ